MKVRIYYHHTDCGKVVYYGKYLEFLEEARTEYFDERGLLLKELEKQGVYFVVARQEIDYKYPAFYGDILTIKTTVSGISSVKAVFECEITNQDNKVISTAKTILVCVSRELKPQAMPQELREKLSDKGNK
ncbi:MAG: thioesterase family protein [Candidatus Omnitrophota bacterium]|jgi:acyl-CoA thioester hydrolase